MSEQQIQQSLQDIFEQLDAIDFQVWDARAKVKGIIRKWFADVQAEKSAAIQSEREACAKVCEHYAEVMEPTDELSATMAEELAKAIRARAEAQKG